MSRHGLTIGKNYCLRLPDGRSLGHMHIERHEDGWAEGPFSAAPAFEDIRELFERETRLRRDQVIPLWEETADAIEALQIQVVEDERILPGRLSLFVEGNEAILAIR